MANHARWRRAGPGAVLALMAACLSCGGETPAEEPALLVAVRRAWQPGERAATIQRIMANRELVFPYVGDLSDLAPQIFADPDSVTVLVPNPALQASLTGPAAAELALFSTAWNFIGAKVTMINQSQTPPDTLFWHALLWSDPANAGDHGFALAFSRTDVFNIMPVNTPAFDAAFGKAGAAAGEAHLSTGTYWQDDAKNTRFQVTSQVYGGGFTTITTGPYLGGQSRNGTQFGRIQQGDFVRQTGTENPANFSVAIDYRGAGLPAIEILCVFPTPCTSNVLRETRSTP